MKKKAISVGYAMLLLISMLLISVDSVQAATDRPVLDGSYLTLEKESIGYDTKVSRGIYLLTGYSKCIDRGSSTLYAGGTTIATQNVETIQLAVVIERAREGDTAWEYYDGWKKTNYNTDRVAANRSLKVESGYYYRVRCLHSANDDVSSSFTDGIFIE